MNLDLGDAVLSIKLHVKGLHADRLKLHVSVPRDSKPEDHIKRGRVSPASGRRDFTMDLKVDNTVDFTVQFTDEMENPVATPAGATVVYSVDDDGVLSLVDDGAGTATVTPVGPLDAAHLHAEVTVDGRTLTGDAEINVVAGDAERVALVAGTPRETTPDV
jgi:hypothetical protein